MSDILTYDTIGKIHNDEKLSIKLSKVPDDFFDKVKEYIKSKEEALRKDPSAAQEFQNAKYKLMFIIETRERKILNMALYSVRTGLPPENLVTAEKPFFQSILEALKGYKQIREDVLEPKDTTALRVVAFTEDVASFVGDDMASYGPFKKGDVASMPEKNAEILIKDGKAETMKVK